MKYFQPKVRRSQMKMSDVKPGMIVKSKQLGVPVSGRVLEVLEEISYVDVKGSEIGLFDEAGSVYNKDIILVKNENKWEEIDHGT